MNKANELLRRMLPLIVWPEKELLALCKEAVAYLNSEEGKKEDQEPIGRVITIDPAESYRKDSWVPWKEVVGVNGGKISDDIPDGALVYLHPAPSAEKREPITEDEMTESQARPRGEWEGFVAGVRFAEKHHGIGGEE